MKPSATPSPMKKIVYVGLDVHKESVAVAIAPQGDTEDELYGQIGIALIEARVN